MIGLGVDTVEVDRFRRVLARTPGLVARVFTEDERRYAAQQQDPTERLAVRFAAKEAVMKVLGVGIGAIRLNDIEVIHTACGAPGLRLHGTAADLAAHRGVKQWWLSLTHTQLVATAVAAAE